MSRKKSDNSPKQKIEKAIRVNPQYKNVVSASLHLKELGGGNIYLHFYDIAHRAADTYF